MSVNILPIVEGQSEVESVPVLLRRILEDRKIYEIKVSRPFRVGRNRIVREGELERTIKQAIRDRKNAGAILVLLDADDDCPARLAARLLGRSMKTTNKPMSVVLANREFEGWFLGAKESLRGIRGIKEDSSCPPNPEQIRGAKERLNENMQGKRYLEVDDQPAFVAQMDFNMARKNCPSFDKLLRDVDWLIQQIRSSNSFEDSHENP